MYQKNFSSEALQNALKIGFLTKSNHLATQSGKWAFLCFTKSWIHQQRMQQEKKFIFEAN
jgi:hypothetical protein